MKKFIFLILILISFIQVSANCDYFIKTKKGYRFNCGKVYYTKSQAKDVNKRLFNEKVMPLVLKDRKIIVKFNHYKVLSVTQKLNAEQLELITEL